MPVWEALAHSTAGEGGPAAQCMTCIEIPAEMTQVFNDSLEQKTVGQRKCLEFGKEKISR